MKIEIDTKDMVLTGKEQLRNFLEDLQYNPELETGKDPPKRTDYTDKFRMYWDLFEIITEWFEHKYYIDPPYKEIFDEIAIFFAYKKAQFENTRAVLKRDGIPAEFEKDVREEELQKICERVRAMGLDPSKFTFKPKKLGEY